MIDPNLALKFPKSFPTILEKVSGKKGSNAPTALVLCAEHDFNGCLSGTATQAHILQIAKTHQVVVMGINDAHQFDVKIRRARSLLGRDISLLAIVAHGTSDRIVFGSHSIFNFFLKKKPVYEESDIRPEDFSFLARDANIALYSCCTGLGLAQKISDLTKRTVFAPTDFLDSSFTFFNRSRKYGIKMVSYKPTTLEQHVRAFRPNAHSQTMTPKQFDSTKNKELHAFMAAYVKKRAFDGDSDAQYRLGVMYERGWAGLQQSDVEAEKYFRMAATGGSKYAQMNLGVFYGNGRGGLKQSDVEAEKWLRRAADQGCGSAQHYLGLFYLHGRGGLVRSRRKAAKFFCLASNSRSEEQSEAIYNLGLLCEYGRGVQRSIKTATRLYENASELGLTKARDRLLFIVNNYKRTRTWLIEELS